MSKQSDAKAAQGYVSKAIPQTCMHCANFDFDVERRTSKWLMAETIYYDEKNLRCTIGGFAVKKMAACNLFLSKIDVG